MGGSHNDYDTIAERIDEALVGLLSDCHAPNVNFGDSVTVTKDGLLAAGIGLARLRDWVKGLAEAHRQYAAMKDSQ